VDARDVAQAIRKALEAPMTGAEVFIIASADAVMRRPNAELMAEMLPAVPMKDGVGPSETLLSIAKAQRMLEYQPQYSWRETREEA
jgi:nucleoside-diphosphate-sugar epimerase